MQPTLDPTIEPTIDPILVSSIIIEFELSNNTLNATKVLTYIKAQIGYILNDSSIEFEILSVEATNIIIGVIINNNQNMGIQELEERLIAKLDEEYPEGSVDLIDITLLDDDNDGGDDEKEKKKDESMWQ